MITEAQVEESRRRLNIPPDWVWAPCAAECGDLVWHSGEEQEAVEAHGSQFLVVCQSACAVTAAARLQGRT